MKMRYAAVALIGALTLARQGASEEQAPSIAVYPAVRGPAAADPAKYGLDQQEIARRLEGALRASRHFRLFERNDEVQRAIFAEQDFAASDRALGNAAKLGQMYNVALVVVPFISEFRFAPSFVPVDGLPGRYRRTDAGRLVVVFKVLDSTSGEVRHEVMAESGFSTPTGVQNATTGGPGSNRWIAMVDDVSRRGGEGIVDAVWPVKVVTYKDNQLFLNRGQGAGVKVGEVWTLFSVGETLEDPDTHRLLGSSELPIGRVKVVRVAEKFSVAEPQGELKQAPKTGDILRRD